MQYVFMRLEIDLYLEMGSLLCLGNRVASERTNDRMKSAVLIKIIYQKVYWTIKSHLECNKGEYTTRFYTHTVQAHTQS